MANALMLHYASNRANRENGEHGSMQNNRMEYGGMRNTYDQPGMAYNTGGDMRQPNQYTTRNEYEGGAESRYRGKDGRWKSGTRRSEYEGGAQSTYGGGTMREYDERRSGGDDDDEEEGRKYKIEVLPQSNVIEWPYGSPDEGRTNRQIGFGAMNAMGNGDQMEHHNEAHEMRGYAGGETEGFSREVAEKWVQSMEPEDRKQPKGGKWTPEMIRPIAQKYGINPNGERFWEFYAVMNAIYSDTSEIAKEYGITTPDYYAKLAKVWLEDRDAVPNKAEMYYKYIVKHH